MLKYPSSIIPLERYKTEIDIDQLLTHHDPYIVRRIDKSDNEAFNRFGLLEPMTLEPDEIPNMSMNLLGGKYFIPYLKFRTIGKAAKRWKGEKVKIRDFCKDIRTNNKYSELFIPMKELHKKAIPFKAEYKKEFRQAYKGYIFEPKQPENVVTEEGESEIKHDPTFLNYWHIVLEVKDFFKKQPIKNANSVFNSSACTSMILNIFCVKGTNQRPYDFDKIGRNIYLS